MSNKFQYRAISYGEDNRWEIMSRLYSDKLTDLIAALEFGDELGTDLIVKHFFNGAAAYANGKICASWSPVGLAFKLPAEEVAELVAEGQAKPLKYFAKSPIKKGYALFDKPDSKQKPALKAYFLKATAQALSIPGRNMPEHGHKVCIGALR
ncbi:MAG: hypothetical protein GY802_00590 [Gammaproteobacteria bacterium]|nr:hypothetical protein [Gammaproteobacteria bacterium]